MPRAKAPVAVPVATTPATEPLARIVRKVERPDPLEEAPRRWPAGVYRVIHGSVIVPLPPSEYTRPDGSIDDYKPKTDTAIPGDEIELTEKDATLMMNVGVIEELDAKPSQVGKGWKPPKTVRNVFAPNDQSVTRPVAA